MTGVIGVAGSGKSTQIINAFKNNTIIVAQTSGAVKRL